MKTQATPKKSAPRWSTASSSSKNVKSKTMPTVEHQERNILDIGKEIAHNLLGSLKSHEPAPADKSMPATTKEDDRSILDKGKDIIQGALHSVSEETKTLVNMGKDLLEKGKNMVGDMIQDVADLAPSSKDQSDVTGFEHLKVLRVPSPKKAVISHLNPTQTKDKATPKTQRKSLSSAQEQKAPRKQLAPKLAKKSEPKVSASETKAEEPKADTTERPAEPLAEKTLESKPAASRPSESKKTDRKLATPKAQGKKFLNEVQAKVEEPAVKEPERASEKESNTKLFPEAKSSEQRSLSNRLSSPKHLNSKATPFIPKEGELKKSFTEKRPATAGSKNESLPAESAFNSKDDFSTTEKASEPTSTKAAENKTEATPKKSFLKARPSTSRSAKPAENKTAETKEETPVAQKTPLDDSKTKELTSKSAPFDPKSTPKKEVKLWGQKTPRTMEAKQKSSSLSTKKVYTAKTSELNSEPQETPVVRDSQTLPTEQKAPEYPVSLAESAKKQDAPKSSAKDFSKELAAPKTMKKERSLEKPSEKKSTESRVPIRRSSAVIPASSKTGLDHTTERPSTSTKNDSVPESKPAETKVSSSTSSTAKPFTSPRNSTNAKATPQKRSFSGIKNESQPTVFAQAKKDSFVDKGQSSTDNDSDRKSIEDKAGFADKKNDRLGNQNLSDRFSLGKNNSIPHFMRGTISSLSKAEAEPMN